MEATRRTPMAVSTGRERRLASRPMAQAARVEKTAMTANWAAGAKGPLSGMMLSASRIATTPTPPNALWLTPWPTKPRRLTTTRGESSAQNITTGAAAMKAVP
jgi:hypothetical protein